MTHPSKTMSISQIMDLPPIGTNFQTALYDFNSSVKVTANTFDGFGQHSNATYDTSISDEVAYTTNVSYVRGVRDLYDIVSYQCMYVVTVKFPARNLQTPTGVVSIDIDHQDDGTGRVIMVLNGAPNSELIVNHILKPIYEYRKEKPTEEVVVKTSDSVSDLRKSQPEEERKAVTEIFTQITKARRMIEDTGNRHDITLMFEPNNHSVVDNGFFELHGLVWTFVGDSVDPKTGLFACCDPKQGITQANVVVRINNSGHDLSGMRTMTVDITKPNHTYVITFNNSAVDTDICNYVFEPIINNAIRAYKQSK